MARTPVMAAGGIVLRQAKTPLVAVVRLRKRNEWVLPKGKLDDGETPRAAAEREVLEETGHAVSVHEFLGTLVYEARGGSKVVHYWRMEAGDAPVRELMRDVQGGGLVAARRCRRAAVARLRARVSGKCRSDRAVGGRAMPRPRGARGQSRRRKSRGQGAARRHRRRR